ncbi:MAG: DUF4845 domain-containing protein [Gammaproteobacteria bacterium]|nr:DUF4845 domain-containing protein [Gammaproteobacteria bacterium]
MINRTKQKGITGIGWLIILALIAFFTLIILKLIPIYLDSFKVNSVLNSIEEEYAGRDVTPVEMTNTILKRLDINMVDGVTKDDIYIERTKKTLTVEIDYEVRTNLMGNVDAVIFFQDSVTLPVN